MCGGTFTHAKAGMKGVDKEQIEKRVYALTVGSKYYENEQKNRERLDSKIAAMKRSLEMNQVDALQVARTVERKLAEIESQRPASARVFIVLDMDAFFAKCEERADPSLRDRVFAVGGTLRPGADVLCPAYKIIPPARMCRYEHDLHGLVRGAQIRRPVRDAGRQVWVRVRRACARARACACVRALPHAAQLISWAATGLHCGRPVPQARRSPPFRRAPFRQARLHQVTSARTHTRTRTRTSTHACTHARTHINPHPCTHTNKHTHAHADKHTLRGARAGTRRRPTKSVRFSATMTRSSGRHRWTR